MRTERPFPGQDDRAAPTTSPKAETQSPARIRVLLVDDHALFRQGVRALLEAQRDMVVVGEAGNGREAIAEALRLKPEVIVMDIAMPIMNGIEATRHLARQDSDIRVLMLTTHVYEENILELMEIGACGYLFKGHTRCLLTPIDFVGRHRWMPSHTARGAQDDYA